MTIPEGSASASAAEFAVPGALLQAADTAPAAGMGTDDSDLAGVSGLTPGRFAGVPAAFIFLGLVGLGAVPILAALVVVAAVGVLVIVRLDAGRQGAWDDRELLTRTGLPADAPLAPVPQLGLFATATRLARRRGIRDLLTLAVPLGAAAFAIPLFGGRVLTRYVHAAHGGHPVLRYAALAAAVVLGLSVVLGGRLRERASSRSVDPDRFLAGCQLAVGFAFLLLLPYAGVGTWVFGFFLAAFAILATGSVTAAARCLDVSTSGRERPAVWLLVAVYGLVVGGAVGTTLLDLIAAAADPRAAVVVLGVAGVLAGGWVVAGSGRRTTAREARDVVTSVLERRSAQERADSGVTPPALEVVGVDFSYGAQQVLRQVSLAVAEGEIAALLGTNGAGKSTLLRVAAGLADPERGVVRLHGEPTAAIGAEELARHRVALVLGGGMTFPGLTVAETLRLTQAGLEDPAELDEVYGRFPPLWHRRNSRSGNLSGGEQQMLALGRALLCRPRLLLVDELTLGLAPKIVADLVELVRDLNAQGVTVVLVEQSVNLATSLATHAFFLERGEVRYDGPTAELLERDDLLRSVFLAAAT